MLNVIERGPAFRKKESIRIGCCVCFATYLTYFYSYSSLYKNTYFIFDSNLKHYFKYGKQPFKSGKNRREL